MYGNTLILSIYRAHKLWISLLPLMISRLMLSLKKASKDRAGGWTSDALSRTHIRTIAQMEFGEPSDGPEDSGGTTSEEVTQSDLSDGRVEGESSQGAV